MFRLSSVLLVGGALAGPLSLLDRKKIIAPPDMDDFENILRRIEDYDKTVPSARPRAPLLDESEHDPTACASTAKTYLSSSFSRSTSYDSTRTGSDSSSPATSTQVTKLSRQERPFSPQMEGSPLIRPRDPRRERMYCVAAAAATTFFGAFLSIAIADPAPQHLNQGFVCAEAKLWCPGGDRVALQNVLSNVTGDSSRQRRLLQPQDSFLRRPVSDVNLEIRAHCCGTGRPLCKAMPALEARVKELCSFPVSIKMEHGSNRWVDWEWLGKDFWSVQTKEGKTYYDLASYDLAGYKEFPLEAYLAKIENLDSAKCLAESGALLFEENLEQEQPPFGRECFEKIC